MQLIYLSPVSWNSFSQRPHKFVEWFHNRTLEEVLWIEPYPTRFPRLNDFRRFGLEKTSVRKAQPHWLRIIRPQAVPVEPLPGAGWINALTWKRLIGDMHNFACRKATCISVGKPSVLSLTILNRLKGCFSVYDAMDDFPAFYTGISRGSMTRREGLLCNKVKKVLVSSHCQLKRLCQYGPKLSLVLNACAAETLPPVSSLSRKREKIIIGYLGTIAKWFDWDFVIDIARSFSTAKLRILGPVFSSPPKSLPNNIELLPQCDHKSAVQAMQDFSIGLIPFRQTKLTASVDPIKYYEYRALGLPVISTPFGEMALREHENGVFLAKKGMNIVSIIERAINFSLDINEIRKFREANSWNARFDASGILT